MAGAAGSGHRRRQRDHRHPGPRPRCPRPCRPGGRTPRAAREAHGPDRRGLSRDRPGRHGVRPPVRRVPRAALHPLHPARAPPDRRGGDRRARVDAAPRAGGLVPLRAQLRAGQLAQRGDVVAVPAGQVHPRPRLDGPRHGHHGRPRGELRLPAPLHRGERPRGRHRPLHHVRTGPPRSRPTTPRSWAPTSRRPWRPTSRCSPRRSRGTVAGWLVSMGLRLDHGACHRWAQPRSGAKMPHTSVDHREDKLA